MTSDVFSGNFLKNKIIFIILLFFALGCLGSEETSPSQLLLKPEALMEDMYVLKESQRTALSQES